MAPDVEGQVQLRIMNYELRIMNYELRGLVKHGHTSLAVPPDVEEKGLRAKHYVEKKVKKICV